MVLSKGRFETEINEIEKLLKKIDFFEERNYYPNSDFDPALYRSKTYVENWKSLISDNIFCFILSDNSVFNFKYIEETNKLSFSYFECPFKCLTYKEYLVENDLEDDYEEKILLDYYEVYLHQCKLKENPIMIRYDLDFDSYYSGLHPVSHLHIGHKNQIRIGLKKILYPKTFVSIVLRQNYPPLWKSIITSENDWKTYFINEKFALTDVDDQYWQVLDNSEFHLL
jgi:hypothetical protein